MTSQVKYGMVIRYEFDKHNREAELELSDPKCIRQKVMARGSHVMKSLVKTFSAKDEEELRDKIIGRSIKYSLDCMGTLEAFVRVKIDYLGGH